MMATWFWLTLRPRVMVYAVLATLVVLSPAIPPRLAAAQTPPDYNPDFPPPADWRGPVFALSQDYPTEPPDPEAHAWDSIDYNLQPFEYLRSVLDYAIEGNADVDFDVANNPVRTWYHTPWLDPGCNGREFIRGLTRERVSRPKDLHPLQTQLTDNWAVGFYNATGGYTIGQVWNTPTGLPDASRADFAPGTVTFKLLFTTASVDKVPFLEGSLEWEANVYPFTGSNPCPTGQPPASRANQIVRLLQIDVAVRDDRATETGWVFGTFIYDASATGATVWDRMVPVGLIIGNDRGVTTDLNTAGAFLNADLVESIINPSLVEAPADTSTNQAFVTHLGLGGRLDGPVDNPISSCMSCHSRASFPGQPQTPPGATTASYTPAQLAEFFTNVPNGPEVVVTPTGSFTRLDYSLQLAAGMANYCLVNDCSSILATAPNTLAPRDARQPIPRPMPITREGTQDQPDWKEAPPP